jgi:hypothetical protein
LAGVLLQIAINIFVIPAYGAVGVAYTSVFVYTIISAALVIVFRSKIWKGAAGNKVEQTTQVNI